MFLLKHIHKVVLMLLMLLPFGCSHEPSKGERLNVSRVFPDVDLYDFISVTDTTVLGFSYPDSLLCKLYHIGQSDTSDVRTESFLRYGRAQNEMLQPLFYASDDILYVVECQGGPTKAMTIDLEARESGLHRYTPIDMSWVKGYSNFSSIYPISGSLFLAISKTKDGGELFRKEVLFLVDIIERTITPVNLVFEDDYGYEDLIKKIVYTNNANIYLNEKKGKLAYTCGEGRLFDLYDYSSGVLSGRNRVLGVMPRYKAEERGGLERLSLMDKINRGIRPSFTDDYICIAYNQPDDSETFKGYPGFYIDQIDVFDWDGRLVVTFKMDKPFSTYKISKDNKYIYTLSIDLKTGETEIRQYMIYGQLNRK